MNHSDMIGHKQAAEGNGPRTDFMSMRKVQPSDRLTESRISQDAEYARRIDHLQGLVDLLPKRDGIWPLQERAKWLRLAAGIFDLGFKPGDGERAEISIAVIKEAPGGTQTAARERTITTD